MVFVNPQNNCTLLGRVDSPSRLVQSAENRTINLTDWTYKVYHDVVMFDFKQIGCIAI